MAAAQVQEDKQQQFTYLLIIVAFDQPVTGCMESIHFILMSLTECRIKHFKLLLYTDQIGGVGATIGSSFVMYFSRICINDVMSY